ncbi:hypothetical protein JCM5296_002589 [Sporobolomyces johnsonii]
MPSNPQPHLSPLKLPLAPSPPSGATSPTSPLPSPAASLEDERRPLLHRVHSFAPSELKRRSAHISDLLFAHADPALTDERPADQASIHREDPHEPHGRSLTRRKSSIFGAIASDGIRRRRGKGYDGEFRQELEGEGANGVRGWYDNFHTIDWIHDAIKHSLRLRRLRRLKRTEGLRGALKNLWDGSQGWVLVTFVGFFTACIAFCIISSEMLLFDLKTGYCRADPRLARRFCCRGDPLGGVVVPPSAGENVSRIAAGMGGFVLQGWAGSQRIKEPEECAAWRTWASVWEDWTGEGTGAGDVAGYVAFVSIAIAFATLASTLTMYFTSSTSVYSSKDSPSMPHPGFSPSFAESFSKPSTAPSPSKYGAIDGQDERAGQEPGEELGLQKPRGRKTLYFAAGSGIPEIKTILSGFVIRGYLGSWTLGVKAVGLALSVASGLSLGKEGPFVHIASCVGNILSRFFPKYDRNEAKRREIISAACAAGVAVSFGAPVGGVLFSLEEVSYFFPPRTMLRSFWCAAIAATTLKLLDPFKSGKIVLFAVSYDKDWRALELVGFLLLGVFGGVYGALFCKANVWWTRHVRNGTFLKNHAIVEVALVTLVTVCISFFNPWTKMGGTELVYEMFSECHKDESFGGLCVKTPDQVWAIVRSVAVALTIKAFLTVVTFGIKLPAGIFIPTLAVGACFGRISGLLVEVLHAHYPLSPVFEACRASAEDGGPLPFGQACVLPGVWAMIGAAGALAGVTRTTVSLAVIVFELTGTLTYSVPTMFAVLVAKTVADAIEPRSIYDLVIEVADLPYLDAKQEYIHASTPGDVLDADVPTISLDADNTVASLRRQLADLYTAGSASGFPIVAQEDASAPGQQRMYAYVASKELEHGLALARARGLADSTPCTFRVASALRLGGGGGGQGAEGARTGGSWLPSGAVTPSGAEHGEVDLSWLVDSAPIVVNLRSPMELLHEMFSKLGVRYLVVVDERGLYRGVIEKNRYLVYLRWLEKRSTTERKHDIHPQPSFYADLDDDDDQGHHHPPTSERTV